MLNNECNSFLVSDITFYIKLKPLRNRTLKKVSSGTKSSVTVDCSYYCYFKSSIQVVMSANIK